MKYVNNHKWTNNQLIALVIKKADTIGYVNKRRHTVIFFHTEIVRSYVHLSLYNEQRIIYLCISPAV